MDDQLITTLKTRMNKALEVVKADLSSVRTGRATPVLVEHIEIGAYGGSQKMQVREMATITSGDATTLLVVPYDPSTIDEIVKGIQEANVGLTPVKDGQTIRISIPSLTEERRQEYLKLAKAKLEAGRIMVRQIRHEDMAQLKRAFENKEITEDDRKRLEKQVQDATDNTIEQLDELGNAKEKELMQI